MNDLTKIKALRLVRSTLMQIAATPILIAAIGCKTRASATPDNFTKALNVYYLDRSECLLPDAPRFPYETGDAEKTRQMDALVKAQLLTVTRELGGGLHASRYTPTDTGARAVPRFCYGHRAVSSIDSFTPPAKAANGLPETEVTYRYEIKDVPVWARTPEVQAAFPAMAKAVTTVSTAKATLAGTTAGWQVPD